MELREATIDDVVQIETIHRSAIETVCATAYSPDQVSAWTEMLARERYVALLERCGSLVAVEKGRILGFCFYNLEEGELNALYIDPSSARRGVGARLLQEVERRGTSAGVPLLRLKATLNSVTFYEHCGYRKIGPAVHRLANGRELPCVQMSKRLP